jgi:hypothetical protein
MFGGLGCPQHCGLRDFGSGRAHYPQTQGWIILALGGGYRIMINEGTPFYAALITIVVMMLLLAVMPAFLIADWVDLRRRQQH